MKKNDVLIEDLNDIEKKLLPYIAEGLTAKEIAPIVFMSHHTVKHYISEIIRKTNARNRVNAVAILIRANYV